VYLSRQSSTRGAGSVSMASASSVPYPRARRARTPRSRGSDPPRRNFGEFVRPLVVPAEYMVKLDAVELVFEGSYCIAVCLHFIVVTTRILHDLVNSRAVSLP
jgi:hypothetical protein